METNVRLKTHSDDPSEIQLLLQQTHDEALQKNECATKHWMKLQDEHMTLHSHLGILPDKLSHEVMVPIGSKALMRGKMVHTNEILVCLGDGWFVKCSAKEAAEICDRRLKLCNGMLKDLEREHNLFLARKQLPFEQDAFGADSRKEILEPYDEKEEAKWKLQHRQKEKEYRQKLSELHNKEKTKIYDEESLWKRLDELEVQEELEQEIDRLHADQRDVEYDESSEVDTEETEAMEDDLIDNLLLGEQCVGGNGLIKQKIVTYEYSTLNETHEPGDIFNSQSTSSASQKSSARHVSFADEGTPKINDSESDSSVESIRIEFWHTPIDSQTQGSRKSEEHPIQTPADIHKHIKELMSKDVSPKPILKNKSADLESSSGIELQRMEWLNQPDSVPITQEMEEPSWNTLASQPLQLEECPVVFGDVFEHTSEEPSSRPQPPTQTRPTSRFRAARLASKR